MFKVILPLFTLVVLSNAGWADHFGHPSSSKQGKSYQSVTKYHIPAPHHLHDIHYNHHPEVNAYPKYKFSYKVNDDYTNDKKNHWETRDGGKVEGQYALLQPDGSTRLVSYKADKHNGFNAIVKTSGGHHSHHLGHNYYY